MYNVMYLEKARILTYFVPLKNLAKNYSKHYLIYTKIIALHPLPYKPAKMQRKPTKEQ